MDEKERRAAFFSAITTEHFVLQTAASATVTESASRASIYILALSSSLVAMALGAGTGVGLLLGIVTALTLVAGFYAYQNWRFRQFEPAEPAEAEGSRRS